jgi:hypothetical protein
MIDYYEFIDRIDYCTLRHQMVIDKSDVLANNSIFARYRLVKERDFNPNTIMYYVSLLYTKIYCEKNIIKCCVGEESIVTNKIGVRGKSPGRWVRLTPFDKRTGRSPRMRPYNFEKLMNPTIDTKKDKDHSFLLLMKSFY